jgi:hypothetical protein
MLEQTPIFTDATYNPEDNKLRLYAPERLDRELYLRLRENGFLPAKIQKCHFAAWTPGREDLCIELFGEISLDKTTLAERAQAKVERLEALAVRNIEKADAFTQAAQRITGSMQTTQPVLIGHHSEGRATRQEKQFDSAKAHAEKAADMVNYWNYRARGVADFANGKSNIRTVSGRIKKLLAELRDRQRKINHGHIIVKLWTKINTIEDAQEREKMVKYYLGCKIKSGNATMDGHHSKLNNNEITFDDVIQQCIQWGQRLSNSEYTMRWISHILNRLSYERAELGGVSRYTGPLDAGMLQIFSRENGAHSPKAKKIDGKWTLTSTVALPLHLGEGTELVLSDKQWQDLMYSVGYSVPAKKPAKAPILNFKAASIDVKSYGEAKSYQQIELTKAEYSNMRDGLTGVVYAADGQFRVKVCRYPEEAGFNAKWCTVYLSDSKTHDTPESECVKLTSEQRQTEEAQAELF